MVLPCSLKCSPVCVYVCVIIIEFVLLLLLSFLTAWIMFAEIQLTFMNVVRQWTGECSPQGNRHRTWLILVCLIVVFGNREVRQKCVWRLVRCWKSLLKTSSSNVAMRTPFMWTTWTSSRTHLIQGHWEVPHPPGDRLESRWCVYWHTSVYVRR